MPSPHPPAAAATHAAAMGAARSRRVRSANPAAIRPFTAKITSACHVAEVGVEASAAGSGGSAARGLYAIRPSTSPADMQRAMREAPAPAELREWRPSEPRTHRHALQVGSYFVSADVGAFIKGRWEENAVTSAPPISPRYPSPLDQGSMPLGVPHPLQAESLPISPRMARGPAGAVVGTTGKPASARPPSARHPSAPTAGAPAYAGEWEPPPMWHGNVASPTRTSLQASPRAGRYA